ncbi:hypothetical protein [Parasitella parasitica]|uniref:Uncharacterized protein n=1 Tax=Parasitella parasitica TaxID=35722 RepID=A0A0B7NES4_9FUNG|nr:hypothetical protein [Parasitella parasitica]
MNKSLPDSDTVSSLLHRIANEKNWSSADTEQDCAVLAKHRLVYVCDLRALSGESWTQIELLPLVKDLLRSSIDPHWPPQADHNIDQIMESEDAKKGKKQKNKQGKKQQKNDKKKQGKKDKGFKSPSPLGTPVVPAIFTGSSAIQELNHSTSRSNLDDTMSQDHLTIQNTIRNGNTTNSSSDISSADDNNNSDSDSDIEDVDVDVLMSPASEEKRKSVSFSDETAIGIAASTVKQDKDKKKDKKDKKDKKKDKKEKKKCSMASTKFSGYQSFKSHPYTTHPIVKFRKMKMKHCKRLPPVPANDQFLQDIRDKLESSV